MITEPLIANDKESNYSVGGMLLINKPLGWTSFDVVGKLRYAMKKKYGKKLKVGHAGTLDPLATGLLIICSGAYTKKLNTFQEMDKEYEGVFVLGATRPSFDKETEISHTFPVAHINEEAIHKAATQFIGETEQVPPVFSAIKVDGKRAYKSAHKGRDVEMTPRKVTISALDITHVEMPCIHFRVACSKGTYIRALARDFGKALGSGAYLDALTRTRIGNFSLGSSLTIQQAEDLIFSAS